MLKRTTLCTSDMFCNDGNKLTIGHGDEVIIQVEDSKFRCDRSILITVSRYFEIMFNGMFKESRDDEIILYGISASSFEAFSDLVHLRYPPKFNKNNILDILRTGDFLACDKLVHYCIEYIIWVDSVSLFDLDNTDVLKIYRLLNHFIVDKETRVLVKLRAHIGDNLKIFSGNNELLEMSFNELMSLLRENQKMSTTMLRALFKFWPIVRDMDSDLDLIIRWIYYSHEKRAPRFEELSIFVNFECISADYKRFLSKNYGMPNNAKKSFEVCLVDHVRNKPDENAPLIPMPYGILSSYLNLPTIHVFVNYDNNRYDKKFTTIFSANGSEPRKWNAVKSGFECSFTTVRSVALGDNFFSFGWKSRHRKYSPFRVSPSVHMFRDEESKILAHPPCKSDKFDMCGVSANNRIYWCNNDLFNSTHYENLPASWRLSFDEDEIRRGIYQYDCQSDRWYSLPEVKKANANACLIADDNRIYLIGGRFTDQSGAGYAQALDCRAPKWQQLPRTHQIIWYDDPSGCSLNGNIYVSSGERELVEKYDSRAGKWYVMINKRGRRSFDQKVMGDFDKRRMVSFKNLLWQFNLPLSINCDKLCTHNPIITILDPYERNHSHKQWRQCPSLRNTIHYFGRCGSEFNSSDGSIDGHSLHNSDDDDDDHLYFYPDDYECIAKIADVVVCKKY